MNDAPEMLAADRHRLLREHLMDEISRDQAAAAPRARRWPVWLAPPLVVAAAMAGVLATASHHDSAPPPPPPAATSSAPATAAELLERAAREAAARPAVPATRSQFLYTRTVSSGAYHPEPYSRQMWKALDGRTQGLIIDPTFGTAKNPEGRAALVPNVQGEPASIVFPDHDYLAALPTDPAQLLARVRAEGSGKSGQPDAEAFRAIGELIHGELLTPGVRAAFYRAAALIPGVTLVPDVVDATGRPGIAVALVSPEGTGDGAARSEWIFDPTGRTYLGRREVQVTDGREAKAGTVLFTNVTVETAVVDRAEQQPVR
ncbi:CU044_5270 family protein [Kitasatospora sp. NBC_00374]|uniref:CU044_5270 family protein n=1 Tax=Kitasatospora sp. NBC_00374 TaxID=2975964 RepID=UPI0030DE0ABE